LIHPEGNQPVLGLPLYREIHLLLSVSDGLARLHDDSLAPEFFSKPVTQVMAVVRAHISLAGRDIDMLQANSIPVGARLFVFTFISSLKVSILLGLRLLQVFPTPVSSFLKDKIETFFMLQEKCQVNG